MKSFVVVLVVLVVLVLVAMSDDTAMNIHDGDDDDDDDDDVVDKFGGVFSAARLRVRPFGDAPMFISRAQLDVRSNAFEVREGTLLEEEEREPVASTDQFSRAHSNRELIDNDGSPGREGLS